MSDDAITTRKKKALDLYQQHFNCCQIVFAAYRPTDKLDEETALKLASMFGGGVAGSGTGLCGAMMGGLMLISMKYGFGGTAPSAEKVRTYEIGRKFMADFTDKEKVKELQDQVKMARELRSKTNLSLQCPICLASIYYPQLS